MSESNRDRVTTKEKIVFLVLGLASLVAVPNMCRDGGPTPAAQNAAVTAVERGDAEGVVAQRAPIGLFVDVPTGNVRAGPSTKHPSVGQVTELQMVYDLEHDISGDWARSEVPGTAIAGWIHRDLLAATPSRFRVTVAEKYEETLLDRFQEATVRSIGERYRTMRIEVPYVSKVLAHHLPGQDMLREFAKAGFTKVVLTDGETTYSWDLR